MTQKHAGKQRIRLALLLGAYDFIAVCAAYFLALWMRFDFIFANINPVGNVFWNFVGILRIMILFNLNTNSCN